MVNIRLNSYADWSWKCTLKQSTSISTSFEAFFWIFLELNVTIWLELVKNYHVLTGKKLSWFTDVYCTVFQPPNLKHHVLSKFSVWVDNYSISDMTSFDFLSSSFLFNQSLVWKLSYVLSYMTLWHEINPICRQKFYKLYSEQMFQ